MTRKAFSIHYNLKNAEGKVVDTSIGGPPLEFVQGDGSIVKGLEMALLERKEGDVIEVTVPPELAYGNVDEKKIYWVPKSAFDGPVEPGMLKQAADRDVVTVVKVVDAKGDQVLVDGNHPLAGYTLQFEVEILKVTEIA